MKRGTRISAPVSTFAGLSVLVAVLPLSPGSVSVTSRVTNVGGSTPNTLPLYERIRQISFSLTNLKLSERSDSDTGIISNVSLSIK